MIQEEQAIILATTKAQEDFPEYELGPVMVSEWENQDRCWYLCVRLYQPSTKKALDCWYGVSCSNTLWQATLFDQIARSMQHYRRTFLDIDKPQSPP